MADPIVDTSDDSLPPMTLAPDPNQAMPEPTQLTNPTIQPNVPAPAIVQQRTDKTAMGLGKSLNMPKQDIYQTIASGREDQLRKTAAADLNLQLALKKNQDIVDLSSKMGRPLLPEEINRVLDPFNPSNKPADPNDVIEQAYAHEYMGAADTAAQYMEGTALERAGLDIPDQVKKIRNKGTELAAKMEFARTLDQNINTTIQNQGWVPYLWDQAKTMLQPYNELMMRGVNPEVGKISGGILLGDNLKAQADSDFMLPMDEFKKVLPQRMEALKSNPTLQSQYLNYVIGQSINERKLQNIFTLLTPFDVAQGAKGGAALIRKVDMYNRVNAGFKDLVKSTNLTDRGVPTPAVMAEGAGNLNEAAIQRGADEVSKSLQGTLDPVQDIKSKLTSNFRLDGDILDSNPGSLTSTQLTVLKDGMFRTGNSLMDTIFNAIRVNRTPEPLASEAAIRAYRETAKDLFPGSDLLDIGSPRHEPITNTYHVPFTFGNVDGNLFSDAETALNYAKRKGFADARIVEATGNVEREPAGFTGSKKDINNRAILEQRLADANEDLRSSKSIASSKSKFTDEERLAAKQRARIATGIIKETKTALKETTDRLNPKPATIEQQGLGYKIVVVKPYDETADSVRSFMTKDASGSNIKNAVSTSSATGFKSWLNAPFGWIRGADDTLSYNETLQRKIATFTQSNFQKWANEEAKYIENIAQGRIKTDPVTGEPITSWLDKPRSWASKLAGNPKQSQMFEEFNQVLDYARKAPDPATGEPGYFFKTPGEIEDHYQRTFQRLPTFAETRAYFAHVNLVEGNRVLSEIAEFRNRARIGAEQHQIFLQGDNKTQLKSGFFDAIHQKNFPGGEDQILIMGGKKGEEKLYNLGANEIPGKDLERYREQVQNGQAKILRIYDPDSHPLKEFSDVAGNNRVRYVLTNSSESKPLDLNHVNRRGGGHFDYDAPFYVKQAKMVAELHGDAATDRRSSYKDTYVGDNTLMPITNRAMGGDISKKMNQMNQFMKAEDYTAAEALSRELGIEWKEMKSWYRESRDANGKVVPPRINPSEPFYVVPKNKKIYDLDKSLEERYPRTFKDGTKSGSDAQQFQVAYNMQRDSHSMFSLKDVGSQGNPIYKMIDAPLVDPIPTMNRALNRAIQSTFMDDYKMYAVEHWLREATPFLKATESEVRSAPFWHFNNPDFKSGVDKAVEWNLKSNQYKIRQFVGTPNKLDTWIHGVTQQLADAFYTKFGPEENRSAVGRAVTIVPLWALSRVKDPVSAVRSFAFNAKLGVFSLPQFLVQAQNFTTILALEPRRGVAAMFATMLHSWARVNSNPEVLKSLDEYATKLNVFGSKWKPGEFLEARSELAKTGFEHVGGEYAMADDALQHKFIKNEWNSFLDAGQVFFKEGEKASRLGAWYAAFKEFRDLNPTKVLTDADRAKILNKADLLSVNMSRASASSLHGGVLGLTTQFLSYQLRMAELFFSTRIGETAWDRGLARGRMLAMYTAMYGAPSAIGITGAPFGDSIRQYAINNGYVMGDSYYQSLMEGIPAWTLSMATGNQYNVGDRYGSQGFTVANQLRSDGLTWKVVGGAGLGTLGNTIASLDPFWQAAKSLISPDEEGNTYKIQPQDFVNVFGEVSSVDSFKRWYTAMSTGKWMSKNEAYVGDASKASATFMTITGLKPQQQDDVYTFKNIKDSEASLQKDAIAEITKDYRRGIQALADNNDVQANDYFVRARARMVAANIPQDKRAEVFAKATKGYESMIDSSIRNWATKNVPAGQEQTRADALTRSLTINDRNK